jgi:hypothetical protein
MKTEETIMLLNALLAALFVAGVVVVLCLAVLAGIVWLL